MVSHSYRNPKSSISIKYRRITITSYKLLANNVALQNILVYNTFLYSDIAGFNLILQYRIWLFIFSIMQSN